MLKNDKWITEQASQSMIVPFVDRLIRNVNDLPILSYGLSSYGYDVRLSAKEFWTFRHIPGTVVNPKAFDPKNLELAELHKDEFGEFFVLPAHGYGLGISVEAIAMPSNITAICVGKSTMARVGIIANVTPLESAWKGVITLEFSNSMNADCRIYANEGIVQLLFLEGEPCLTTYNCRDGKYQNQPNQVTFAKV